MARPRRISISHLAFVLVAACAYPLLLALEGTAGWKKLPATALTGMLFGLALLAWIIALFPLYSGLSIVLVSIALAVARLKWPEVQVFLARYLAPGWKAVWALFLGPLGPLKPGEAIWARALVVMFAAIPLSWSVQRTAGPFWVVSACTCWLLYLWFNYMDEAFGWLVLLFCAFVPLLAVWRSALRAHEAGQKTYLGRGVAAPVLATGMGLLALLTALALPRNVPPFQMDWLARRVEQAFPVVAEWRGGGAGSRYTLGEAGFGTSVKDLGGPVRHRTDPVAEVDVSPDDGRRLYLRSEVWATYTGRGWENKYRRLKISSQEVVDLESLLPKEAIWAYPDRDASRLSALAVTPSSEQESLLVLTEPLEIRQPARTVWGDSGGSLWLSARSQQGYSVLSAVPRPPVAGSSEPEPGWAQPAATIPQVPYTYLYVPESLPFRVHETTLKVVTGAGGPWEAATRLERYIRGFPYVEDVPYAPRGRDFVDYFLFDLRQGYCAYHSTALAIMCRIAGIPSRWMTGYLSQEGVGVRKVLQENAHAWVEVYIQGSGWIVLEGTPAYDVPDRERQAAAAPPGEIPAGASWPGTRPPGMGLEELEPDEPAGTGEAPGAQAAHPLGLALGGVFVALLGRVGWTAFEWRRRRSAARTASSFFSTSLRLLSAGGLGKSSEETAREYLQRLKEQAPDAAAALSDLVYLFEKEYYGGLEVSLGDAARTGVWDQLTKAASGRTGRARYLLRVYIWPALRA